MKHVLLTQCLQGWEYGTLRSLEREIIKKTDAKIVSLSPDSSASRLHRRFAHGTRYGIVRRFLPRVSLKLPDQLDVLWLVLMGPENYPLDLLSGWRGCAATTIVYLFDTLPAQIPLIQRLFSGNEWDVLITSFNDAVPLLERATRRKWTHVDQAISRQFYQPAPLDERVIQFSAYGRRDPRVHEATLAFCEQHRLYYDFSTHPPGTPSAEPLQLQRQYSWHLSHSLFTFSWPVEVTNPVRASELSPITCRWFEAAAAGTVVIGQAPRNPHFAEVFGDSFVSGIDGKGSVQSIMDQLGVIWQNRINLHARAVALRERLGRKLDWSDRVERMLNLAHESRGGSTREPDQRCASR